MVAVADEVQVADPVDRDRGERLPAALGGGDPLPAAAHARRGRAEAAVEVARAIDGADDRVERDRLEPELDLADHAERLDDLVERQDQRDVVGLAAQPPAELGEQLRAPRAREVVLRVGAGEAGAAVHPGKATLLRARLPSAASTRVGEPEDAVEPGDAERLDDRLAVAGDDSLPPRAFSRRCAPISTPRLEESMNVVSVRSTITCSTPAAIGAITRCLNSGAVNRSTSPLTDDHVGVAADRAVLDRELDRHRLNRRRSRPAGGAGTRARPPSRSRARRRAARSRCRRPGTAASTTSARPPPARSGPTRRSSERVLEASATSTVSSATCAGARAATTSATSTASSSRSSGRSARAANMPTTRRSTGPDERAGGDRDARRRLCAGHATPIARRRGAAQEGHRSAGSRRAHGARSRASPRAPRSAAARDPGRRRPGSAGRRVRSRRRSPRARAPVGRTTTSIVPSPSA